MQRTVAIAFFCILLGFSQSVSAAQPLSDVLLDLENADENIVRKVAQAQLAATDLQHNSANAPEHLTYEGLFVAASNTTQLAIFSDDGCSISINGQAVWSHLNQGQHLPDFAQSFHVVPYTFEAGTTYEIQVQYSNVIYTAGFDVDGVTLFAFGGGGTPPSYSSYTVDIDVDALAVHSTDSWPPVDPADPLADAEDIDEDASYPEGGLGLPIEHSGNSIPATIAGTNIGKDLRVFVDAQTVPGHLDLTVSGTGLAVYRVQNGVQTQFTGAFSIGPLGIVETFRVHACDDFTSAVTITATFTPDDVSLEPASDVVRVYPMTGPVPDIDVDADADGQIAPADDPIESDPGGIALIGEQEPVNLSIIWPPGQSPTNNHKVRIDLLQSDAFASLSVPIDSEYDVVGSNPFPAALTIEGLVEGDATVQMRLQNPVGLDVGSDDVFVKISSLKVNIVAVDSYFAPGIERCKIRYQILPPGATAQIAKLEVFGNGANNLVFSDSDIPKSGINEYAFESVDGWPGTNTGGGYVGPEDSPFKVYVSASSTDNYADGVKAVKTTKVLIDSIDVSVVSTFPEEPGRWYVNTPGEGFELTAFVKLKSKAGGPVVAPLQIPVNWSFVDPGKPNATVDAAVDGLGKKDDPDAVWWEEHASFPAIIGLPGDETSISYTESDPESTDVGKTKVVFLPSAVGGDDFVILARVLPNGPVITGQTSRMTVWRYVDFRNKLFEMDGVTHISENAKEDIIQPFFDAAFVRVFLEGAVNKIDAVHSVPFTGLFTQHPDPQTSDDLQLDWALVREPTSSQPGTTLSGGVFNGQSLAGEAIPDDSEIATTSEIAAAESGDMTSREIVTKRAQGWAERINQLRITSHAAFLLSNPLYEGGIIGVKQLHPKVSTVTDGQWSSVTNEWRNSAGNMLGWLSVAPFGSYLIQPDAIWGEIDGLNQPSTGTVVIPVDSKGHLGGVECVIAHEVAHATKTTFQRVLFGPTDHSPSNVIGLMTPAGSSTKFNDSEISILRGYKGEP